MIHSEEMDSDDSTNAFAFVSFVLSLASASWGLVQVVDQPFTDAELANFVDTWEPEVWGGLFVIALFVLGTLACGMLALCSRGLPRKLFGAASIAFIAALALEVTSLNILAARAEQAAGHALSWRPFG